MIVLNATIHRLDKDAHEQGEDSVVVKERDALLPVNDLLVSVAEQTIKIFAKNGNNTGTFGVDEDLYRFPIRLAEYRSGDIDFLALTKATVGIIKGKMQKVVLATGGHAFFLHYEQGGQEYILVAMLKLRDGAGISEGLEFESTLVIDTERLHEAARVSFSRWEGKKDSYLTFVKARGKDEVSGYFRDALACVNYTSAKDNTKRIIVAARAYVETLGLTEQETQQRWKDTKRRLFDCFDEGRKGIVLATIAAAVDPANPDGFTEFVTEGDQAAELMVSHDFVPDAKTFTKLRRIKATIGTVSVSFDVSDADEGRVTYDSQSGSLTVYNLPEDIREELKSYGQDPAEEQA